MTHCPTGGDAAAPGTVLAPAALVASTSVLLAALVALGDGVLATPPAEPEALLAWATSGDPVLHAAAIGRLVALAGGGWLLVATVVGIAVRLVGSARGVAIADRWSPAIVRRCMQQVGAATLAGTLTIAAPTGVALAAEVPTTTISDLSPAADDAPVATMTWERDVEEGGASASVTTTAPTTAPPASSAATIPPPAPPARAVPLEPRAATSAPTEAQTEPSAPPTSTASVVAGTSASGRPLGDAPEQASAETPGDLQVTPDVHSSAASITVRAGDHLWGIATSTLSARGEVGASAQQVATYWLALIDQNADRFVEPGNPDLIVPGQVLVLP